MIWEIVDSSDDEVYHTVGFFLSEAEAIAAATVDSPDDIGMDVDSYASVEVRRHPIGINPSCRYRVVFRRKWAEELNEDADEFEWRITETEFPERKEAP